MEQQGPAGAAVPYSSEQKVPAAPRCSSQQPLAGISKNGTTGISTCVQEPQERPLESLVTARIDIFPAQPLASAAQPVFISAAAAGWRAGYNSLDQLCMESAVVQSCQQGSLNHMPGAAGNCSAAMAWDIVPAAANQSQGFLTDTQHSSDNNIMSQQELNGYGMPNLPAIRTALPQAGSSTGGIRDRECCHCGKTEEKQWRRYTVVPVTDTRPLCNRCFMWRRNRGGSTSFNQDLLPGPEILATNTPRNRGCRNLFRQDSKSKKVAIAARARASSGFGLSANITPRAGVNAPITPAYYQASWEADTQGDLAVPSDSACYAAAADPADCVHTDAAGVALPTGVAVDGAHQYMSTQQDMFLGLRGTASQGLAATAFAAAAAAQSPICSPTPKQNSPARSQLGVRKSVGKSPVKKVTARRAILSSSNPGTPSHLQHISEHESSGLEANEQLQQQTRDTARRDSKTLIRRSGSSSGYGSARGRSPAIYSPRVSAEYHSAAEADLEVAAAAEVLADLLLLQGGAAHIASSAPSMEIEEVTWHDLDRQPAAIWCDFHDGTAAATSVRGTGVRDSSAADLAPETPNVGVADMGCFDGGNGVAAAAMHAVEDLPWVQNEVAVHEVTEGGLPTDADPALAVTLGQEVCDVLSAATAGFVAAAAGASNAPLPVSPEVVQAFVAALLAGVPAAMTNLNEIQASFERMQQQLKCSAEMQQLLQRVVQAD